MYVPTKGYVLSGAKPKAPKDVHNRDNTCKECARKNFFISLCCSYQEVHQLGRSATEQIYPTWQPSLSSMLQTIYTPQYPNTGWFQDDCYNNTRNKTSNSILTEESHIQWHIVMLGQIAIQYHKEESLGYTREEHTGNWELHLLQVLSEITWQHLDTTTTQNLSWCTCRKI